MKKLFLQAVIIVALFVGVWQALNFINWMKIFDVKDKTVALEEKLGDTYWDLLSQTEQLNQQAQVAFTVDTLFRYICTKNNIDYTEFKLHIIEKDEINAFALPNKHIVIYTGLLKECNNQAELCGIMSHELAHIEKRHIMDRLVKEFGLSALLSITTGGNSGVLKQTLKLITSTAYDRKLETEADLTAVDYLITAQIDPNKLADFLYRLGDNTSHLPNQLYWISTHPESRERATTIINKLKKKQILNHSILTSQQWNDFKLQLQEH